MVNYILSFCKITGASRIFSRNFYLPLLKPQTPKDALRTYRITGKWLLGAKIHHYIPVLRHHSKKRSNRSKSYGKKRHKSTNNYINMSPIVDQLNETLQPLLAMLPPAASDSTPVYVYPVHDRSYNIVLGSNFEQAITNGDIVDVLVSQHADKVIIKLKSMKKVPLEIEYYEGSAELRVGEGATQPEDEKFHHHGKWTMALAKIFEEKEMEEEKWEEELRKLNRRRRRQIGEGSRAWRAMMKETIQNLNWERFEDDAKRVIDEIGEPLDEKRIEMEVDDLNGTTNVNETLSTNVGQLPNLDEIPDLIRNMSAATLSNYQHLSGVKLTLTSGKEVFISGQMVQTSDGAVFVPGQTIENEFGLEYAPGITINIDGKPTLISGLIMGEEAKNPMFLPTQSTITSDGQLTFVNVDERPKIDPNVVPIEQDEEASNSSDEDDKSLELEQSDMEELDIESMKLKQEAQRVELEKLKDFLLDDGMNDLLATIEDKRALLQMKLDELRQVHVTQELNLVSYITPSDARTISCRITSNGDVNDLIAEILTTMTRRASNLRDKNSLYVENVNTACIPLANLDETDLKLNAAGPKLKTLLKMALVAANDAFKVRPKDQKTALAAIGEIVEDVLKNDRKLVDELMKLMGRSLEEHGKTTDAIFKQLTQKMSDTKVANVEKIRTSGNADEIEIGIEKVLKLEAETKCAAFIRLIKTEPNLIRHLIDELNDQRAARTELEAMTVLETSIERATRTLLINKLPAYLSTNLECFIREAGAFARALGETQVEANLTALLLQNDETIEFLHRMYLCKLLTIKDYALRTAIERLGRNPERGRADPRVRQLIRESALLLSSKSETKLRSSRDLPFWLLKEQNLLAIEDYLVRRGVEEFPVLVVKGALQAVVPKEAARGVLAGRIAYTLIDESGSTKFRPFGGSRDYGVGRRMETSVENKLAKSNVRKLKRLLSCDDKRRQNA